MKKDLCPRCREIGSKKPRAPAYEDGKCKLHSSSPAARTERQGYARSGGKAKAPGGKQRQAIDAAAPKKTSSPPAKRARRREFGVVDLSTLDAITETLADVITEVKTGAIMPDQAACIAKLCEVAQRLRSPKVAPASSSKVKQKTIRLEVAGDNEAPVH